MARKVGQIVGRGHCTCRVRVYIGRDPDSRVLDPTYAAVVVIRGFVSCLHPILG